MNNTLIVGLLVLLSSCVIGVRQILLGPNAVNYPRAEPVARVVMFIWSASLLLRGTDLLLGWAQGRPEPLANIALFPSVMLAVVQTIMLHNTMRQRLPARMWQRMDRAVEIATCNRRSRFWDWARGRETFADARRSALIQARTRETVSPDEAAVAMAEAVLRGEQIAAPYEKPGRLH